MDLLVTGDEINMKNITRPRTRRVMVGKIPIGCGEPISIQSMTNTDTNDVCATVSQIKDLIDAGCDIIRVAVPTIESIDSFKKIRDKVDAPLVADIHFNYRIALGALDAGADKIRINPGNIGSKEKLEKIIIKAKKKAIPIRIGVNAGSIEKEILRKWGKASPEAMVESSLKAIRFFESFEFHNIIISLKAFDIWDTLKAYRLMAEHVDYPFHIGITEAGLGEDAVIRSSVGIGSLLSYGLGDTVRVSLTGNPVQEVFVAAKILKCLNLKRQGVTVVSCPTCGRCSFGLEKIAQEVKIRTEGIKEPLKVAVMGCAVNGPGEARDADVGIAGTPWGGVLFKKGEIIRKLKEQELTEGLMQAIHEIVAEKGDV